MMSTDLYVRPRGPYSLALTARFAGDATRRFHDGTLTAVLRTHGHLEQVSATQHADGTLTLRAPNDAARDQLRFVLALDDDHSEFLRRFSGDPLLGAAVHKLQGLRKLRVATVAQALLRALCGQLIESSRARALERRIVREATPALGGLHAPPSCSELGGLAPARLRALGLHARRGAALVRLCGSLELERLKALSTSAVAARLGRERGLGPWSVGVVCLEGLGRCEVGLVGDLGLIKLASALRGRWVDASETAELLEPYGEWAGLASVYLLAGFGSGLIPLPQGARVRLPPARFRVAAA
jgi:AraC family transcriptional regulator, regulatory protein of adaptative response / DNA-3-methyladenine glycosylase II